MARARLLKPGFFKNVTLAELRVTEDVTDTPASSFVLRLCFEGLWTLADRAGRLSDVPKWIKSEIFPYDHVHVEPVLGALAAAGFIKRYTVRGEHYIAIPKFLNHQTPHHREAHSLIPAPGRPRASTGPGPEKARTSRAVPVPVPVPVYGDGEEVPPVVPLKGGRFTKREIKAAENLLAGPWLGYCQHDPQCEDAEACVRRIALRNKSREQAINPGGN